jgi:hypothetical protein
LVQKLVALKFKQKVLIFRKICAPKFLGCYSYLSNKHENFVDDPEELYRLRRREAQAKKLKFVDPKAEAEGSSESPKESPPPSPRENQLPPLPMGEQP